MENSLQITLGRKELRTGRVCVFVSVFVGEKGIADRLTIDLILKKKKRCIFRFRANLIVEGGEAFGEETWSGFQIGGAEFKVGGPCRR